MNTAAHKAISIRCATSENKMINATIAKSFQRLAAAGPSLFSRRAMVMVAYKGSTWTKSVHAKVIMPSANGTIMEIG